MPAASILLFDTAGNLVNSWGDNLAQLRRAQSNL